MKSIIELFKKIITCDPVDRGVGRLMYHLDNHTVVRGPGYYGTVRAARGIVGAYDARMMAESELKAMSKTGVLQTDLGGFINLNLVKFITIEIEESWTTASGSLWSVE